MLSELDFGEPLECDVAIAGAGLIGSVRVQIGGKVERGSAKAFSLVASDLILVE